MRVLTAYILYGIGHAASVLMRWRYLDFALGWLLAPVYTRVMGWSDRIQSDGPGPWGPYLKKDRK